MELCHPTSNCFFGAHVIVVQFLSVDRSVCNSPAFLWFRVVVVAIPYSFLGLENFPIGSMYGIFTYMNG